MNLDQNFETIRQRRQNLKQKRSFKSRERTKERIKAKRKDRLKSARDFEKQKIGLIYMRSDGEYIGAEYLNIDFDFTAFAFSGDVYNPNQFKITILDGFEVKILNYITLEWTKLKGKIEISTSSDFYNKNFGFTLKVQGIFEGHLRFDIMSVNLYPSEEDIPTQVVGMEDFIKSIKEEVVEDKSSLIEKIDALKKEKENVQSEKLQLENKLKLMAPRKKTKRKRLAITFDGGGVKGLALVVMLQKIWENKILKDFRPCQVFDLMCGTSTGGLLALGLGVKCMTLEQAFGLYYKDSEEELRKLFPAFDLAEKTTNFAMHSASGVLEQYKEVYGPNLKLSDTTPSEAIENRGNRPYSTNVAVTATRVDINPAYTCLFKNYNVDTCATSFSTFDSTNEAYVWEAARSTSSAPGYFPPYTRDAELLREFKNDPLRSKYKVSYIEDPKIDTSRYVEDEKKIMEFYNIKKKPEQRYILSYRRVADPRSLPWVMVDGGVGLNNPLPVAISEAPCLFGEESIEMILSLGCGNTPSVDSSYFSRLRNNKENADVRNRRLKTIRQLKSLIKVISSLTEPLKSMFPEKFSAARPIMDEETFEEEINLFYNISKQYDQLSFDNLKKASGGDGWFSKNVDIEIHNPMKIYRPICGLIRNKKKEIMRLEYNIIKGHIEKLKQYHATHLELLDTLNSRIAIIREQYRNDVDEKDCEKEPANYFMKEMNTSDEEKKMISHMEGLFEDFPIDNILSNEIGIKDLIKIIMTLYRSARSVKPEKKDEDSSYLYKISNLITKAPEFLMSKKGGLVLSALPFGFFILILAITKYIGGQGEGFKRMLKKMFVGQPREYYYNFLNMLNEYMFWIYNNQQKQFNEWKKQQGSGRVDKDLYKKWMTNTHATYIAQVYNSLSNSGGNAFSHLGSFASALIGDVIVGAASDMDRVIQSNNTFLCKTGIYFDRLAPEYDRVIDLASTDPKEILLIKDLTNKYLNQDAQKLRLLDIEWHILRAMTNRAQVSEDEFKNWCEKIYSVNKARLTKGIKCEEDPKFSESSACFIDDQFKSGKGCLKRQTGCNR